MADIVSYYRLNELPFELTPNLKFYCFSENHKNAFDLSLYCINNGEGLIKVTGEVGSGKTMLCRKLLNAIDQQGDVTLYVPNPSLSTATLLRLIADEMGISSSPNQEEYTLTKAMTAQLVKNYQSNQRTVLIVDEAQSLSDESIEAIRLLTNLESEDRKLLQIVLLGQPELDEKLNQSHLRQVRQRIGFSYRIDGFRRTELDDYLAKRLISAGHDTGLLFTRKAKNLLYRASHGTPRVVNILAYKSLLAAYTKGCHTVGAAAVKQAIRDSSDVLSTITRPSCLLPILAVGSFVAAIAAMLLLK